MSIGILTIKIHLPGCSSLKEKRRRLKPLINRLHREFNISVAEIDHLDVWQTSMIACALVSNDHRHTQRCLQSVVRWVEDNWPDIIIVRDQIEII
jgi:uncharacterized protein YlxP (DUF503 family)